MIQVDARQLGANRCAPRAQSRAMPSSCHECRNKALPGSWPCSGIYRRQRIRGMTLADGSRQRPCRDNAAPIFRLCWKRLAADGRAHSEQGRDVISRSKRDIYALYALT